MQHSAEAISCQNGNLTLEEEITWYIRRKTVSVGVSTMALSWSIVCNRSKWACGDGSEASFKTIALIRLTKEDVGVTIVIVRNTGTIACGTGQGAPSGC